MKKEGKFYKIGTELDLEVGQQIWHQDPHTNRWNSGRTHEQLEKPHSYTLQDSEGKFYQRNRNWIKPRQVDILDAAEVAESKKEKSF